MTRPTSSKRSLRSFARTSARVDAERVEQVERLAEHRAARDGQREAVEARAHRPLPAPLADERDVQALDVERPARGGQVAAEAAEQVVVAAAAAQRRAERGVVDLEDGARVVGQRAREAEVEDHAAGDLGRQLGDHGAQPVRGLARGVEHLGAAAALGHAQERLGGLGAEPQALDLALQPDEVARLELVQDPAPRARPSRRARRAATGTATRRRGRSGSPRARRRRARGTAR